MEINRINVGQIVSMKSAINHKCRNYKYKKERRIFFFWKRAEGFYDVTYYDRESLVIKEEIEKNKHLICVGEEVFYKPHLQFRMSNNTYQEKYFESVEELKKFVEESELAHVYWINKN